MRMKKCLSILLAVVMITTMITSLPITVNAASNTWDPDNGVYDITTEDDLFAFRDSLDNEQQYEKYLILSALNDAQNLTMENFSLQMLASYIFETDEHNIERAQTYINQSLEDAKFYNSKLRIIEISERLPSIISKYEKAVRARNNMQKLVIISVSILLFILLGAMVFIFKQNAKLTARRKELSERNQQLSEASQLR